MFVCNNGPGPGMSCCSVASWRKNLVHWAFSWTTPGQSDAKGRLNKQRTPVEPSGGKCPEYSKSPPVAPLG